MSLEILWTLPTSGDGRSSQTPRPATLDYLADVARAVEFAGFDAVFLPSGRNHLDPFLVAAGLAPKTSRLNFLVSFRAGLVLPAVVAQQIQTLQNLSHNRIQLHLNTSETVDQRASYGDLTDSDILPEQIFEFVSTLQAVWRGRPLHHEGLHFRIQGGGLLRPLATIPSIDIDAHDKALLGLAAEHAERIFLDVKSHEDLRPQIQQLRELAAVRRRNVKIALHLSIVTRDTEEEAWSDSERWASKVLTENESHHSVVIGSHQSVIDRLLRWKEIGVDSLVLSSYPHLEEALRVSEEILPSLRSSSTSETLVSLGSNPPGVRP